MYDRQRMTDAILLKKTRLACYETLHTSILIPGDSLRELCFFLKTRNLLS